MGTTELQHTPEKPGGATPFRDDPPAMALRTYTCLRLGAIGVIAVLAVSLFKEYHAADDCLQGSISAYYYTSVQSVFVGALVALGLVMIVLWGRTEYEDGFLNLAGLVAPVVAFVPTANTNKCGLATAAGDPVKTPTQKTDVIEASRDAVFNNMLAYIIVVGAILVILLAVGIIGHVKTWPMVMDHPLAYWLPWAGALALWTYGTYRFWQDRDWFYGNAHKWSALTLFFFIVLVVIDIGFQKWRGKTRDNRPSHRWAFTYWALAALMSIGAVATYLLAKNISDEFSAHRTFFVEAWMIFWLAVFWAIQTWDRWKEGAPRTKAEEERMKTPTPQETPA